MFRKLFKITKIKTMKKLPTRVIDYLANYFSFQHRFNLTYSFIDSKS